MGSKEKEDKQYGLILSKKKTSTEIKRAAVFNVDSDSDASDSGTTDWIKKAYRKQVAANSGRISRQTQIDRQRALEQDATVYQYDEVYDEIEKKKEEQTQTKKEEKKKPRYIQNLLKKAEARKIENERRVERQVQKEREEEGEEFKDKETFVTSAYKKKLEEFQKLDEEERRQDMLEDICDVSKQQDLGGFYRHLYRQTVDIKKEDTKIEKEDVKKDAVDKKECKQSSTKRQYRKRRNSPEPSSAEEGERLDSDTDCSSSSASTKISSGSSSRASRKSKIEGTKHSENEMKVKKQKLDREAANKKDREIPKPSNPISDDNESSEKMDNTAKEEEKKISEPKKEVEVKPKINVWQKRTVGTVFDEAVKRYFERKALRQGGHGN